jgi:hypothetical protein
MNICEHRLAWRWTEPDHEVSPDTVLAQMSPVAEAEAERLCRGSLHLVTRDGLHPAEFSPIARRSADVALEVGRDWLREQQPILDLPVVVSWDESTAHRTTWEVFTAHWDTFCYPASDDVLILPDSIGWALAYFHWEEFQFGQRSTRVRS